MAYARGRGHYRNPAAASSSTEATSITSQRATNPANDVFMQELREMEGECLRTGKQNLRLTVKKAIKSVQRYPLPITSEEDACALEGVGQFMASRMMRALRKQKGAAPHPTTALDAVGSSQAPGQSLEHTRSGGEWAPAHSGSAQHDLGGGAVHQAGLQPISLRDSLESLSSALSQTESAAGGCSQEPGTQGEQAKKARKRPVRPRSQPAQEEAAAVPTSFAGGDWEALLLVDHREQDCLAVQAALLQNQVPCEVRQLPLGDMLWVARRPDSPAAAEVLLGYIVERKTAADLAASIVDGRYVEQKRRLVLSGAGRAIYLVEGSLSGGSGRGGLGHAALRAAAVSTQIAGFAVVHTANLSDSLAYLTRTHRMVAMRLAQACNCQAGPHWAGAQPAQPPGSIMTPGMTFCDYQERCGKNRELTVRTIFGMQLRQVLGCSAGRVEAILQRHPTPLSLLLAMESVQTQEQREDLFRDIGGTKVGKQMARSCMRMLTQLYGNETLVNN